MKFEWDPAKDQSTQDKHGLSFEEAATVFGDPLALSWEDAEHSVGEHRMLTLGYTERQRLVLVAHTERDDRLRIISARLGTAAERRLYESG
ncbi:MAG: BrnT family toxin [Acidobacteria bacterium]|nr:BrnT family toxin [Acidobacteriota bacterium]